MKHTGSMVKTSLLLLALLACATACYRMPTEDDYSVIPMTNNPDINGVGGTEDANPVPGLQY